ncbi:Uncharacterised protein [Budvicia aquatica]|uniref:Uncharacterized protein n=1 Tax=Budvicia aquatica TaxID=82979 RepID=A0A484ZW50_9GAMM|nr:hypothetical protein [Budvicia aquatica]VFS52575.1 Uncharacterised protein [Budvicia aquatica]
MKLPSILRLVKPKLPKFKASVALLLVIFAVVSLIWLWIWGPEWKIAEYTPFASLVTRLLITALYIHCFYRVVSLAHGKKTATV